MYIQFGVDIYKIILDKKNPLWNYLNNFLIFFKKKYSFCSENCIMDAEMHL